jgi:hypothetical protein
MPPKTAEVRSSLDAALQKVVQTRCLDAVSRNPMAFIEMIKAEKPPLEIACALLSMEVGAFEVAKPARAVVAKPITPEKAQKAAVTEFERAETADRKTFYKNQTTVFKGICAMANGEKAMFASADDVAKPKVAKAAAAKPKPKAKPAAKPVKVAETQPAAASGDDLLGSIKPKKEVKSPAKAKKAKAPIPATVAEESEEESAASDTDSD